MNLDTFKEQLKSYPHPVLVDVWAPWCVPCRITKPIMESLAKEYEGKVAFWAINADEHSQLLRELKIFSIPTVLITREGNTIKQYTGAQSRESYRAMFEALANTGEAVVVSISMFDRFVRVFAGMIITTAGLLTSTWLLIPAGGLLVFLGVYDRCPIWRAITAYIKNRTP